MTISFTDVFQQLQASWSPEDRITGSLVPSELMWRDDHPLSSELKALRKGRPCSLPYIGQTTVTWVTFGGAQEDLLETIEDLRCWVLPYLGRDDSSAIVTTENAKTPREGAFCAVAGWYFRWQCPSQFFKRVTQRLKALSTLLDSRPPFESKIPPSLNGLRLDFVTALRTGDWGKAEIAVNTIDQWQLDTARNTQLMRVRLLCDRGDLALAISSTLSQGLLQMGLPSRLRSTILGAIFQGEFAGLVEKGDWRGAVSHYQKRWHATLADPIISTNGDGVLLLLKAFRAFVDNDQEVLREIITDGQGLVPAEMLSALPSAGKTAVSAEPVLASENVPEPSIGTVFWNDLAKSVIAGEQADVRVLINDMPEDLLTDPEWISVGADALVDLFTNPILESNPRSKLIAEEVLVSIVDLIVNSADFPKQEHSRLYEALISTWVMTRGKSAAEQEGQLLLGLISATMQCSTNAVVSCETAIREWWSQRRSARRIPWLLAALDTVMLDHPKASQLQDLWIDALDVIKRQGLAFSLGELKLWRRLGRLAEIDEDSVNSMLPESASVGSLVQIDPIATAGLRKIAVVTLQERAGQQAVVELKARTGADVFLVTSVGADELTRSAETADLILFVWASCKHAVYRAFDKVRHKIAYVQGTGPSSIVLAAEHWAVQHATVTDDQS